MEGNTARELKKLALQIRIGIIEEMKARGFGHIGGSLSISDVLAVLYGSVMRYDPKNPHWEERDKLVCSKGHAGPALYAVLALKGFFPYALLKTLNQPGTSLPSHCDRRTPGVDMTTGSLGQGTSLAAGVALGDRIKRRKSRTFLIVGDGETNEGQVWEAAMFTAAKRLTNLTWIVDVNGKQLDGWTKDVLETFDLAAKFAAFGFDVVEVDGGDVGEIEAALRRPVDERPLAVIMHTIKGSGVPDVENTLHNHSMNVSPETCDHWLEALNERLSALS